MDGKEKDMDKIMSKKDEKEFGRQITVFIAFVFAVAVIFTILMLVFFNKTSHGFEWNYVPARISDFRWQLSICAVLIAALIWAIKKGYISFLREGEGQWLEIRTKSDGRYSVWVDFKNGQYISPFKTRNGFQIIRPELKGIVGSLEGCLVKDEFSSQKEELVHKGTVKRKQ